MTSTETEAPPTGAADFSFGHLEPDLTDPKRYPMPLIAAGAYLLVLPATEVNRPLRDAWLSDLAGTSRRDRVRRAAAGQADAGDDESQREDDLRLYPRFVVVGWHGILNRAGEVVPFNRQNCEAFLRKIPIWMFDRLRTFVSLMSNFVGSPESVAPPVDKDLVGN